MPGNALWAVLLVAVGLAADAGAEPEVFFVSPLGRDAWSGSLPEPNADRTDGPLATPRAGRDAVRTARRNGRTGPFTVRFRAGTYRLAEPLVLTAADAGTADAPVTFEAYPGEQPVISGGVPVTGWRRHNDRLMVADVPWLRGRETPVCQLFADGKRRPRARTPNEGTYFYSKRLTLTPDDYPVCLGLTYDAEDRMPEDATDRTVVNLFHNWVNSYNRIASIDRARRRITFARPAGIFFLGPDVRYYVENSFECLDSPGEWFADPDAGKLYYYPLPGEDVTRTEIVLPRVVTPILRLAGDPEAGLYAEYVEIRGLSFRHADADLSPEYAHSVQGAVHQRGAIVAVGARNTLVEGCEFTQLGEHAVSFLESCSNNTVRQCHVFDVGGAGVYLSDGGPPSTDETRHATHNRVENNFIHDGGHIFRAGTGVFLGGYASYNTITHNEICDLSWMGVHAGWSWTGRAPAYTHHNTISYNHIHHLGNGVLNDIGGIYTLGVSTGTVLHHNLIHDITRFERGNQGYGGWGIYLDAGSSEIRVENNVVYRTRDGGFHAHCDGYPYGDVIVNNIFAYADDGQLARNNNKEPEGPHLTMERNIVLNADRRMLAGGSWGENVKVVADRNVYWCETGDAPDFAGRTFAEWQAFGRDAAGIVADPGFVNPAEGDFRLKPDSPALAVGFEPVDVTAAGLTGDAEWRELPNRFPRRTFESATPPPDQHVVADDFEEYQPGEAPDHAVAPEGEARVEVVAGGLDPGGQCLRFTDAAEAMPWKPHWYVRRTPRDGAVRIRCLVRNDADRPALFDLETRDWPAMGQAGYTSGPYLRFHPDGRIMAASPGDPAWVLVGTVPPGTWMRVDMRFAEGPDAPRTFALTIAPMDGDPIEVAELPFRSEGFRSCSWVGLAGMDTAPAVFYADDFRVE